jgi:outer membrane receptor protein involved in Fe transport
MFYASYSRGYKAAPFNLDPSWRNMSAAATPFAKAEYDNNIELGGRSQLFDGRAIINLTLFHERFRDFQINTFNGLTFAVSNFRHVFADGVELESTFEPIDGLTLNESVTFANSRYGHDVPTLGFPLGAPTILAGHQLTQAPLWTINSGLNYSTAGFLTHRWLRGRQRYTLSYNTGSTNPNKLQPGFATVNGQIGIKSMDDFWDLSLFGRNMFNEHYNVVAFNTPAEQATGVPSVNSAISVFPGDPATFGITLSVHY